VPEEASVRAEILLRYYNDPIAGYFGVDKTHELIKRYYYWLDIVKYIKQYIRSCDVY